MPISVLIARIAQLVERRICNAKVGGSTPSLGTIPLSSVGTPTWMSRYAYMDVGGRALPGASAESTQSTCRERRICNAWTARSGKTAGRATQDAVAGGSTPSVGTIPRRSVGRPKGCLRSGAFVMKVGEGRMPEGRTPQDAVVEGLTPSLGTNSLSYSEHLSCVGERDSILFPVATLYTQLAHRLNNTPESKVSLSCRCRFARLVDRSF